MIEIDEAGTARVDTVAEALAVVASPGVKNVVVRDKDEERRLWGLARALMSGNPGPRLETDPEAEARATLNAEAAEHAAKAERLTVMARDYRRSANDPDAGGSSLRAIWARQADAYLAEAQVQASLAAAKRST